MSRETTALIAIGPNSCDPWGDSLTHPTHVVRLTENSIPGWQVHSLRGAHGNQSTGPGMGTPAATAGSLTMAHELVVLLAADVLHDPDSVQRARDERLLAPHPRACVRFSETAPSHTLVSAAVGVVATGARLWISLLDTQSLLAVDGSIDQLRSWGIRTEVLTPNCERPDERRRAANR